MTLNNKNPYILLHLSVLLAGFTGVFAKLISLNEGLLTWYRMLIAGTAFFFVLKSRTIKTRLSKTDIFKIGGVGLLLTLHWILFYGSIKYSNISVGVICYALSGFFTAIFVPIVDKKKLNFTELLLSLITLAGIALIFHFDASFRTGIMLGIISAAVASIYTIYNARLVRQYDTRIINFYQILAGVIVLSFLLPFYLKLFPTTYLFPDFSDWIYLLILALVCTVGLYTLFAEALKQIPAFTVNLTFNLEPIYSIIIAFLFFNEAKEVSQTFYLGLFLVILSVALQSYISVRQKKKLAKAIIST